MIAYKKFPKKQGLYNPEFEHDACGIGFTANIKGRKSHATVKNALSILVNLDHRGGISAEENTGDGAGILTQLPYSFFSSECSLTGIKLPKEGDYAAAMIYLPINFNDRKYCEKVLEEIVKKEGQFFLGWRTVPVNDSMLGYSAKACMPFIRQAFIGKNENIKDELSFERRLYIIRKQIENTIKQKRPDLYFYIASFSCKTIVYKGMLKAGQLSKFYVDLNRKTFKTSLAMVHSRYSTNTFPSWDRAHPNRYIIHNGEINTLRGNINWTKAREAVLKSEIFKDEVNKILPVINSEGSDSAMFDNTLEFLYLSGHSLQHAAMMMIPEPWSKNENMPLWKKAFYEYNSCLIKPWDGPAAIGFTNGTVIGAILDRNGLRPSRYYVTKDDTIVFASEAGVLDIPEEKIICKKRLKPGKMLLIDTKQGKIISDEEIKKQMALSHPYKKWIDENLIKIKSLPVSIETKNIENGEIIENIVQQQEAFGYTYEDLNMIIKPMAEDALEPTGAMGCDTPLAVLSLNNQLLYNYFKQLFAQVTNPPIDAIREEIVTGTEIYIGSAGNLMKTVPQNCRMLKAETPIIDNNDLDRILNIKKEGFDCAHISMLFNVEKITLEQAMYGLYSDADRAIAEGANLLVLSDRGASKRKVPIPALLAVSGLHHHLIKTGQRTQVGIILESGEPREVHHFCLLLGYGVSAVNPYMAFASIKNMIDRGLISETDYKKAVSNYIKAVTKGMVKVISKMGISTLLSYQGAQIFEAVGLSSKVIDKYFTGTPSRIEGLSLFDIEKETKLRHYHAFYDNTENHEVLPSGGNLKWKSNGEYHLYNPMSVYRLQRACKNNSYEEYKKFSSLFSGDNPHLCTLRSLMKFKTSRKPIDIKEVEPIESILKRFKTGAMSYGSISREAHETLAIAMNRIGGKSNTGEGGEVPERFITLANGDSKNSAIKQVASGRFGVTGNYLINAAEIQIKMAQGAKPGEGGQLPGRKVYPWIANSRYSTPGVGLISPPPHHDIYSIEDLAQLIHDLKNANRYARINVKLVSEAGVGTIASGVAKGRADVVLISGYDGGTGAAPTTSMRHAGLPWELGLSETHQALMMNRLRSRITVETDGKLMTGKDVVTAALLGAEEFGFATAPLIAMGCVMMRVCNLDTCPVGIATQNPELRKNFKGRTEYVENFFRFIALETREYMAQLGFKTINEMVGRTDFLEKDDSLGHWKTKGLDFSSIFYLPDFAKDLPGYCWIKQNHNLNRSFDVKVLEKAAKSAILNGRKVYREFKIKNTDRVVGTITGSDISSKYGEEGLPDDTVTFKFNGSAGQSFGAFIPKGMSLILEGDSNDYIGKGLSGGKIIVKPPSKSTLKQNENILIGNVAFYGATRGEAYIAGAAGERFCVRNSGIDAVVEGVGDHGCEYMTGGRVVILGRTGKNFAAGMSGGIVYIYDTDDNFLKNCNTDMVDVMPFKLNSDHFEVREMIKRHIDSTGSQTGRKILDNWTNAVRQFKVVIPRDYRKMLLAIDEEIKLGKNIKDARLCAFLKLKAKGF